MVNLYQLAELFMFHQVECRSHQAQVL